MIQSHDIATTIRIFEDLYRGTGADVPTTADNRPEYFLPIGRLSASLRKRVEEFRVEALSLRRRAEGASESARGRFSGAADEARERLSEVREDVREQLSEFRSELGDAAQHATRH